MNIKEIRRRRELDGHAKTTQHFTEALQAGHLQPEDFSLRDLAEGMIENGTDWVRSLDPRANDVALTEADGVDVTAFANITGQVVYSKILQAYKHESFVLSKLIGTTKTRLDGEKIPGVEGLSPDGIEPVNPGMPFPNSGFGEDYIETPSTQKRGFIVPVTKEAVFFDRTNLVLKRASEVGELMGYDKEIRLADLLTGITNNYKRKGTAYNTYQTSTPWINKITSNEFVDWTDVDAAEQLFADMPAYKLAAARVIDAAGLNFGDTTAATASQTVSKNLLGDYKASVSRVAYRRLINSGVAAADAKKYWFLGDFKKAFTYMENWPITVRRARRSATADFERDIIAQFRADERGAAAVLDPRYIVQSTG